MRHKRYLLSIHETPAIRAAYNRGDLHTMQRLILAHLRREIDGPRTMYVMRNGRKVLRAVA